jgi:DNA-binding response OmpR family regulator
MTAEVVRMFQSRILIIDSNRINADFIAQGLKNAHFQVCLAANNHEALGVMAKELPELIMLNSGTEGLVLCRQIRDLCDIPIIMISESNNKSEELQALNAGAEDFLTIPFSMDILASRVKAIIRRSARNHPIRNTAAAGEYVLEHA